MSASPAEAIASRTYLLQTSERVSSKANNHGNSRTKRGSGFRAGRRQLRTLNMVDPPAALFNPEPDSASGACRAYPRPDPLGAYDCSGGEMTVAA